MTLLENNEQKLYNKGIKKKEVSDLQDDYLIKKYALSSYHYNYRLLATHYDILLAYLPGLEQLVRQTGFWDKLGFRAFLEYIGDKYVPKSTAEEFERLIQESYQATLEIGSPVYTKMFLSSSYSALEKIEMLLRQLGAYLDDKRMLQVTGTHHLSVLLPPHDRFFHVFAQNVQKAYHASTLNSLKVHQLRMYFDRQNIVYVRNRFKKQGMTDEMALQAYVKAPQDNGGLGGKKLLAERGRYHNKVPLTQEKMPFNRKRLGPNFHSEFILNEAGDFVSQWNVLEEDSHGLIISDWAFYRAKYQDNLLYFEGQLMNGESFNYASSNGKVHRQLDVSPSRYYDYLMRNQIAKKWSSPELSEYHWYKVDIEKSPYHKKGF